MEAEVVSGIGYKPDIKSFENLCYELKDLTDCWLYEYALELTCLMALADAFGFEYGEFV